MLGEYPAQREILLNFRGFGGVYVGVRGESGENGETGTPSREGLYGTGAILRGDIAAVV